MFTRSIGFLVLAIAASTGPSWAGVYKCNVDGKTVFSDRPCSDSAEEMIVKYSQASPLAIADLSQRAQSHEQERRAWVEGDRQRRGVNRQNRRIRALERERDAELADLRHKKKYANNNLAGASWEQSISQEMAAVTAQYGQKIESARSDLEQLKR